MIATARLTALPVFIRLPGIWKDHFQPVGLAVWTTVYSTPLYCIGDNDPAAKKISDKFPNKTWTELIGRKKIKNRVWKRNDSTVGMLVV